MLLLDVVEPEGFVGVQSIASASCTSASSSIRSGDEGPAAEVRSDGRPKIGLGAALTTGVEDKEREARRSGSAEGLGAGDERALLYGEGVNEGSVGNL